MGLGTGAQEEEEKRSALSRARHGQMYISESDWPELKDAVLEEPAFFV